jgi:hypothetical protein
VGTEAAPECEPFLMSLGTEVRVMITDEAMLRDIFVSKHAVFHKPKFIKAIMGEVIE